MLPSYFLLKEPSLGASAHEFSPRLDFLTVLVERTVLYAYAVLLPRLYGIR